MTASASLTYAILFFAISALMFRALFLGARRSREPWWANERLTADVWLPLMLLAFSFALSFLYDVYTMIDRFSFDPGHATAFAAMVAVTGTLWWLLGLALRSARPSDSRANLSLANSENGSPPEKPSPVNRTSPIRHRKAA